MHHCVRYDGTVCERLDDPGRARRGMLADCFEAFLGLPGERRYWEINLAANGDWVTATLNLYDRNGESLGPSFLCQWHVVDARLQAYLDARPRIRMGS